MKITSVSMSSVQEQPQSGGQANSLSCKSGQQGKDVFDKPAQKVHFRNRHWPKTVSAAEFYFRRCGRFALALGTVGLSELTRYAIRSLGIYPNSSKLIRKALDLDENYLRKEREAIISACGGQEETLRTPDGKSLNALWIPALTNQQGSNQGETVIFFTPNMAFYEQHKEVAKFYQQQGFNVLLFNRRGVGKSGGSMSLDPNSAVLDGETAYQFVREKGISDKKLVLHGWSIGGAEAAQVARNHPEVNLVLDRTLKNLNKTASYMVPRIGWLFKWVTFGAWKFNTEQALKEHLGNRIIFYCEDDDTLGNEAKLGPDRKPLTNEKNCKVSVGHNFDVYYYTVLGFKGDVEKEFSDPLISFLSDVKNTDANVCTK